MKGHSLTTFLASEDLAKLTRLVRSVEEVLPLELDENGAVKRGEGPIVSGLEVRVGLYDPDDFWGDTGPLAEIRVHEGEWCYVERPSYKEIAQEKKDRKGQV